MTQPKVHETLRITTIRSSGGFVTLRVDGRIVADVVDAFERECRRSLEEGLPVQVDLSAVTFIDGRGVEVLRRLHTERLQLVHCPVFVQHLLGATER